MRWTGHVSCTEETRTAYKVSFGKPVRKRPLARPGSRWEDITWI
jgi:hypothetical protein